NLEEFHPNVYLRRGGVQGLQGLFCNFQLTYCGADQKRAFVIVPKNTSRRTGIDARRSQEVSHSLLSHPSVRGGPILDRVGTKLDHTFLQALSKRVRVQFEYSGQQLR